MKRAVEFRTEARRLRHAFGRLTEPSLNRAMSSASPAVQRNIDHCRSMRAKGIDDGANRQLVETLLRYMETSVAGAGRSASNHEHDALQASVTARRKAPQNRGSRTAQRSGFANHLVSARTRRYR